ncbi:hypothetical protein [Leucobacter luti]|uniref:hypothetical protein n=1 Tax=Leucobacter luti TaxID=340320 RepID=UPI003D0872FC
MSAGQYASEADVLAAAGRMLARGIVRSMSMDPHDAALAAFIPNVTPPVEELEAQIRSFHVEAEARVKQLAA